MSTEQLERLAGPAGRRTTRPARSRGTAVLIASLVLVALAGAAFGVYEYTQAKQGADELDALRTELSMTQADVAAAEGQLDAAGGQRAALEATLADAQAARDAAGADRDAIAALFPITPETYRAVPIGGAFSVAATPDPETCTGFSDTAATCVPANFPADLVVLGSAEAGYQLASSWFDALPLTAEGSGWSADGAVYDTVANTCGGEPLPTRVQISVAVSAVTTSDAPRALVPAGITGKFTISSVGTDQCIDATRTAAYTGQPT